MAQFTFNNKHHAFYAALKTEVDKYFQEKKIKKTGNWKLFLKTGILIPAAILVYISLLAFDWQVIGVILFALLLGLIYASIGFNVMHDANHGSYSRNKTVNEILGLSLNFLGGNAFIWKQKHNIIHHTYTNIDGLDDDISFTSWLRLCPTKRWMPIHRLQHIYLFFIYSLTSFAWMFGTDFKKYFSKKIYTTSLQKMDTKEHIVFWVSKLFIITIYMVLPILIKGWFFWLVFFLSMHLILGFTLAIVFQLAHVVEHTEFETTSDEPKMIETEWAVYQVKSTANFATGNKVISWLVGGLNFQVEHHLFPRISHIHYPALSKIVKRICELHNIPYNSFPTMWAAIVSHVKTMKELGKKPVLATVANQH